MNVTVLSLLYTDFVINVDQILPCVNYLCTIACSSFVLKHITSITLCICFYTEYKNHMYNMHTKPNAISPLTIVMPTRY